MATWICDNCTMPNSDTASSCEVCEQKKPNANSAILNTKPQDASSKPNEWRCDNCTLNNEGNSDVCAICGHSKAVASNHNRHPDNTNDNTWTCDTCTFQNQSSSLHCHMCQSINPKQANPVQTTYCWEWKGGKKWHDYPEDISNKIEKAYFAGTLKLDLNLPHAQYVIDLTKLQQINTSSSKSRQIQRVKWECIPSQSTTPKPTSNKTEMDIDSPNQTEANLANPPTTNTNDKPSPSTVPKRRVTDLMDLSSAPEQDDEDDTKMTTIDDNKMNKPLSKKKKKKKKQPKKKQENNASKKAGTLLAMFEKDKKEDIPSPVHLTKKKKRKLSDINKEENDSPPKKKQKVDNATNKIKIAGKYATKQSASKELGSVLNKCLIDALWELSMIERNAGNKFKANAYSKACKALRTCDKKISSGKEAKALNGVGKKIAAKIDELLSTGHLVKLDKLRADDTVQAINELCQIHGIGPKKAAELVKEHKIFTLEALRQRKDLLNQQQKVGLKYFEYIDQRIPRDQCTEIGNEVRKELDKIDGSIVMDICGSYRRGKADCGDVDILLTHSDAKYEQKKHSKKLLADIVRTLKQSGLLVEDLAHGPVKYMGICRYEEVAKDASNGNKMMEDVPRDFKFDIPSFDDDELMITLDAPDDNKRNKNNKNEQNEESDKGKSKVYFRRIDLKFINYKMYYANLLYFTGSDRFNVDMRLRANEKHLILNENGIYTMLDEDDHTQKSKDPVVQPTCEKDIFDVIGMDYVEPKDRSW